MKYRYITEYTACLNTTTPVLNYDLLSGNAMADANFAIRIAIPNDMELDYEATVSVKQQICETCRSCREHLLCVCMENGYQPEKS